MSTPFSGPESEQVDHLGVERSCESTTPALPERAYLMMVVEVDHEDHVLCQAEGCCHSVYKRIHVVLVGLKFEVLGSQCYQRLYGHLDKESMAPQYGSGDARRLTAEERSDLIENTATFIANLEAERQEYERQAVTLAAEEQRISEAREVAHRLHLAQIAASVEQRQRLNEAAARSKYGAADHPGLPAAMVHARRLLQSTNPGMNFDSPGWSGLVLIEAKRMIREGKVPGNRDRLDDNE